MIVKYEGLIAEWCEKQGVGPFLGDADINEDRYFYNRGQIEKNNPGRADDIQHAHAISQCLSEAKKSQITALAQSDSGKPSFAQLATHQETATASKLTAQVNFEHLPRQTEVLEGIKAALEAGSEEIKLAGSAIEESVETVKGIVENASIELSNGLTRIADDLGKEILRKVDDTDRKFRKYTDELGILAVAEGARLERAISAQGEEVAKGITETGKGLGVRFTNESILARQEITAAADKITKAIEATADVVAATSEALALDIKEFQEKALAKIGSLLPSKRERLAGWIFKGAVLALLASILFAVKAHAQVDGVTFWDSTATGLGSSTVGSIHPFFSLFNIQCDDANGITCAYVQIGSKYFLRFRAAGGTGITSLGGQTGATQTFSSANDTNVTLTIASAANNHGFTVGWTGTLANARLTNSSVTVNTAAPLGGGGALSLGGTLNLTCTGCLTSVTAHNLFSATHGDTVAASPVRGDIIIANSTPAWTKLALGAATAGKYAKSDGTDVVLSSGGASGVGSKTCTNQFLSAVILAADTATDGTCTTATLASAQFANQGTTTTLLHGAAAGNPSFSAVISADLNITTTSCTNQFVTALSSGAVGTCTTATLAGAQFANQGTTTTVLHGNAAGNPSFGAVSLTADVTGVLPSANGGAIDPATQLYVSDWFCSGLSQTSGSIGSMGWGWFTSGSGTAAFSNGTTGSPCGIVLDTAGAALTMATWHTAATVGGVALNSDTFQSRVYGKLGAVDANTSMHIGFTANPTAALTCAGSVDGIYLERLGADTDWFGVACKASVADTRVDTGVAAGTSATGYTISRIDANTIGFKVTTGSTVCITTAATVPAGCDATNKTVNATHIPTVLLNATTTINSASGSKTFLLSFFDLLISGLARTF